MRLSIKSILIFYTLTTCFAFSQEINDKQNLIKEKAFWNSYTDKLNDQLSIDRKIELKALLGSEAAKLRVIDKIYGTTQEIIIFKNLELQHHSLTIKLSDCFYDSDNFINNSLALLMISDNAAATERYSRWMSSRYSHLTNFSNYRFSIWLLSCKISNQE